MASRSFSSALEPLPASYLLGRWFTAARREGLLALLAPEEWHTLSALLSFTRRDGRREFTVDQLGIALGLSRDQAQARLDQLVATQWQGEPLAVREQDGDGRVVGVMLAPLAVLAGPKAPHPTESPASFLPFPTGPEAEVPDDLETALQEVGLNPEQIERLWKNYPRPLIRRQLDWLPKRQARNPAALLIRAIEGDWGPPREVA